MGQMLLSRKIAVIIMTMFSVSFIAGTYASTDDVRLTTEIIAGSTSLAFAAGAITDPEKIQQEILESIKGFKEMIKDTPNREAFKALQDDFNNFKTDNDLSGFTTQVKGIEQDLKKLNDKVGKLSINAYPGGNAIVNLIQKALGTDEWKSHLDKRAEGESPIFSLKDIDWGAAGANGTNDVTPNARPFMIPQYPFEEPFDIRAYLPTGMVDTGSLTYPQELLYTDGMGVVSETGASSATSITFQDVTENAHRIGTHAIVSRRALKSTIWLANYLANRFMEKFIKELNTQSIAGDGTGENLDGLLNQATTYAAGGAWTDTIPSGESTLWDCLLAMKSQLRKNANAMANACFVSSVTHYQLTVQKATTREFAYDGVIVNVDENGVWRVNGMSLAVSDDVPDGDALIGLVLPTVVELLLHGGIDMSTSNSHAEIFTSSQVAFRFEADVLMPIYRPYAFLKERWRQFRLISLQLNL